MVKRQNNKRLFILLALIVVVGAIFIALPLVEEGAKVEVTSDPDTIIKVDDMMPEFTVEMTTGDTISSKDLLGKVVLINFWATWCPPCQQELLRVQEDLLNRFQGLDFVFLPISRGEKIESVKRFQYIHGYLFPAGIDRDQSIYNMFAKEYIPRNYLINRQGVVVNTTLGYSPEEFDKLIKHIDMTLKAR